MTRSRVQGFGIFIFHSFISLEKKICFSWPLSHPWSILNSELLKQCVKKKKKKDGEIISLYEGGGIRLTNHFNDRKRDVFLASC